MAAANSGGGVDQPTMDVREFVQQIFPHDIPYKDASKYQGRDILVLADMLSKSEEDVNWPNIVTTMCYIGTPNAVKPLTDFFSTGEGRLTDDAYVAKDHILVHLGDLTNKSKSPQALDFLMKSVTDTGAWTRRDLNWTSPFDDNREAQFRSARREGDLGPGFIGHARIGLEAREDPLFRAELAKN